MSYLVANPKDRFSRDEAQIPSLSVTLFYTVQVSLALVFRSDHVQYVGSIYTDYGQIRVYKVKYELNKHFSYLMLSS